MSQSAAGDSERGIEIRDIEVFKDYLSDPRFRIKMNDEVTAVTRATLARISGEKFPFNAPTITGEAFTTRLADYEDEIRTLQMRMALLGKWATAEQLPVVTNILARVLEHRSQEHGTSLWVDLRYYPSLLLLYSLGIASLAAENYGVIAAAHSKRVQARKRRGQDGVTELLVPVVDGMLGIRQTNIWKHLDHYKQMRVPESEHVFKTLRPVLEDLLFLGDSYEELFDRYEVLQALTYADATDSGWGPVGRFAWKFCRGGEDNPYAMLRAEASKLKDAWGPFQAGMFRGSFSRFNEVATRFENDLLQKLGWY